LGSPKLFIKLSTRSAKDAVDKNPEKLLEMLKKTLLPGATLNDQLIAVRKFDLLLPWLPLAYNSNYRAFISLMGQSTVEESLGFLNNSARIISDIKRVTCPLNRLL